MYTSRVAVPAAGRRGLRASAAATAGGDAEEDLFESMTRGADVQLVFRRNGSGSGGSMQGDDAEQPLRVHSSILRLTSKVLDAMLADLLQDHTSGRYDNVGDDDAPRLQLCLDDDPAEWRCILPMLYPRMHTPRLTWEDVRLVINVAHKYDMPLVLKPCERFLLSEQEAPLSCARSDPNYVLDWLEISERLHLDGLQERCLRYIKTDAEGTAASVARVDGCDYCVAAANRYRQLSSYRYVACVCICRTCGGRRKTCGCDGRAAAAAAGTSARLRLGGGGVNRASLSADLDSLYQRYRVGQAYSTVAAATAAMAPPVMTAAAAAGPSGMRSVATAARRRTAADVEALFAGPPQAAASSSYSAIAAAAAAAGGLGSIGGGGDGVPVREVVLRDREGLSRLSVRTLVDLLTPNE